MNNIKNMLFISIFFVLVFAKTNDFKVNSDIEIIGVQPTEGSKIPGIRRWKPKYIPEIFQDAIVDKVIDIDQQDAENSMKSLSQNNGLFVGVSAGANVFVAKEVAKGLSNSIIVTILCDRGDRYLSKI